MSNLYVCRRCGKRVRRNSDKAFIKSFCTRKNVNVHLMRVVSVVRA